MNSIHKIIMDCNISPFKTSSVYKDLVLNYYFIVIGSYPYSNSIKTLIINPDYCDTQFTIGWGECVRRLNNSDIIEITDTAELAYASLLLL